MYSVTLLLFFSLLLFPPYLYRNTKDVKFRLVTSSATDETSTSFGLFWVVLGGFGFGVV